jgi:biopolymer transport protein TolR
MAITARSSRALQSEINVTPLVDVVLVLLIIFMVVTPILQMGIDVEVPPKVEVNTPPPPNQDEQLVILIKKDGTYLNSAKMADTNKLKTTLASILGSRKSPDDRVVFVNSLDDVPFDQAVVAMDAAKAAGAHKIGFLTDPPQ